MPKTIVFCADGTWNAPADDSGLSAVESTEDHGEVSAAAVTNVVKLFENLAGTVTAETRSDPKEREKIADDNGRGPQIAKYIHGVGNSPSKIFKVLGGMFGVGVIMRIVRGYTFLSRHYDSGDAIHVVGFSRGAYTARALAGLIAEVGLLDRRRYDPADRAAAYRRGFAAWCRAKSMTFPRDNPTATSANRVLDLLQRLVGSQLDRDDFVPDVRVASVAVWDTVGSLGIPDYEDDARVDVLEFGSRALSPKVERGFHAMAIDELRRDFPVARWEPRAGIEEVWFAGAHGDVGGGYAATECGLSDIALGWMMQKLRAAGVRFATSLPHRLDGGASDGCHEPWAKLPFSKLPQAPRTIKAGDVVHESVRERWENPDPLYRPRALHSFTDLAGFSSDDGRYL